MTGCGGCGALSVGACACDPRLFAVDHGDGEGDPSGVAELGELSGDVRSWVDALAVGESVDVGGAVVRRVA